MRADKLLDLRGNQHDSIESETMLYRHEIFVKGYQMGINIRVKFIAENIELLTLNTRKNNAGTPTKVSRLSYYDERFPTSSH